VRKFHSWNAAVVGITIIAMLLTHAASAQSPSSPGGDAPILYLPVVMAGSTAPVVEPEEPPPSIPFPEEPTPVAQEPIPQPKGPEPVVEVPAEVDSPDARLWDIDSAQFRDPNAVEAASSDAVDWNVAGSFTVSGKLGVGWQTPAYLGDFRQSVNGLAVVRVTNPNAGAGAVAGFAAGTMNGTAPIYVFGPNWSGAWGGFPVKNYAMLRSDSGLNGLIVTSGGADPLIFGVNEAERARITSAGYMGIGTTAPSSKLEVVNSAVVHALRLRGPGGYGSQARLNFGDSDFVYIDEPIDDSLRIHGADEINLETPRVEVNGIKPVKIVRLADINGNVNTGISASTYDCVVAGFSAYYDIQEDDPGISAIWTHTYGGTWWVQANLRSHNDNDFPDVDILCFVKSVVEYTGDRALWDPD
jgi:hypothetical protein